MITFYNLFRWGFFDGLLIYNLLSFWTLNFVYNILILRTLLRPILQIIQLFSFTIIVTIIFSDKFESFRLRHIILDVALILYRSCICIILFLLHLNFLFLLFELFFSVVLVLIINLWRKRIVVHLNRFHFIFRHHLNLSVFFFISLNQLCFWRG